MDLKQQLATFTRKITLLEGAVDALTKSSSSDDLAGIPGRDLSYCLVNSGTFTIDQAGRRGQPIPFLVSQDGVFVMTHYPHVSWKPNAPANATNFGRWSPIASWPLPTQEVTNIDRIDLSWELLDAGSQRNFQNSAPGPIFGRANGLIELPKKIIFQPNSSIQFTPIFEAIFFDSTVAIPTTSGELRISLPGYRKVNQ